MALRLRSREYARAPRNGIGRHRPSVEQHERSEQDCGGQEGGKVFAVHGASQRLGPDYALWDAAATTCDVTICWMRLITVSGR